MSWENVELCDVSEYRTERIETNLLNEKNYVSTENMLSDKGGIVNSSYPPSGNNSPSFKADDILVSNIRPYFKKIWFAQNEGGCSNDVIVFKPNKEKIDPKFLYFQLSKDEFFDYMMSGANGTKMPRGNKKAIPKFKFSIPTSLETQKRIASILSNYDDLIENNLKRIKLLEETAQNIYKEWFVNFRFPNYEHTEFDAESGLPMGWEILALNDIYDKLESGSRPKGGIDKDLKNGIPSIGAESIRELGYFDFSKTKFVSNDFFEKMNKGKIEDRDILIYKDGAYIGKTTLFQDDFPYSNCGVNEHVFLLNTKNKLHQYYLFFILSTKEYYLKMQNLNSNSAQPGINQNKLLQLELLMTNNEDLLISFNEKVEPLVKQIYSLAKINKNLKEARDILLPRLMNRTIEV
jgi:type I restriction enzyme S subunit